MLPRRPHETDVGKLAARSDQVHRLLRRELPRLDKAVRGASSWPLPKSRSMVGCERCACRAEIATGILTGPRGAVYRSGASQLSRPRVAQPSRQERPSLHRHLALLVRAHDE